MLHLWEFLIYSRFTVEMNLFPGFEPLPVFSPPVLSPLLIFVSDQRSGNLVPEGGLAQKGQRARKSPSR